MARHASLDITDKQEANLRKLAAYLMTLPADYPDFEMDLFVKDGSGHSGDQAHVPVCGTAACAAGHGPVAGILPVSDETWWEYSCRAFAPAGDEWSWCFNEDWARVDNSAHGAAKRILWMLDNGVPEDADDQLWEDADLCYLAKAVSA